MQVDTLKSKLDPIQMKSTLTHTWNSNIDLGRFDCLSIPSNYVSNYS